MDNLGPLNLIALSTKDSK